MIYFNGGKAQDIIELLNLVNAGLCEMPGIGSVGVRVDEWNTIGVAQYGTMLINDHRYDDQFNVPSRAAGIAVLDYIKDKSEYLISDTNRYSIVYRLISGPEFAGRENLTMGYVALGERNKLFSFLFNVRVDMDSCEILVEPVTLIFCYGKLHTASQDLVTRAVVYDSTMPSPRMIVFSQSMAFLFRNERIRQLPLTGIDVECLIAGKIANRNCEVL